MRAIKIVSLAAGLLLAVAAARPADRVIYPAPAQAKSDIAAAVKTAAATHKRVLLDFGGNWCGDCQVLNIYMHNQQNLGLLNSNFVLVPVNIGQYDANLGLAARYGVPLKKGVPALVVLSDHGKVLYTQKHGEFETMRKMDSSSVTKFLVQWRPERPGCSVAKVSC